MDCGVCRNYQPGEPGQPAEQGKPEHYDGEPCSVEVRRGSLASSKGLHFVHTGELRLPKQGEWFLQRDNMYVQVAAYDFGNCPQWILRAVPKQSKPTGPRVTVLTFDKDGKQGSYGFRGEPDWPRIEREMLADGYMAVIVKGVSIDWHGPNACTAIWDRRINPNNGNGWHDGRLPNGSRGWNFVIGEVGEYAGKIRQAIADWREKQPKPAQPVTLSPEQAEAVKAAVVKANRTIHELMPTTCAAIDSLIVPAKPEPEKPTWKVGDWAYMCEKGAAGNGIVQIIGERCGGWQWQFRAIDGRDRASQFGDFNDVPFAGNNSALRPLTPADWTREIGGVKVRAYEDEDNDIAVYQYADGNPSIVVIAYASKPGDIVVAREFCRLANLPIMPYSLSGGKYDPPDAG